MRVTHPHCAGIDIHKKSMTVCIFADQANGSQPAYYKRNFATHSAGIQELQTWLQEHQVSEVGMEATGVYWKPVWNALEGKYGLHLCNPEHIRAIPGAKTDLRDGTRIADLLAYGKLPESFIPPRWQRELRDLTRMRTQLQQGSGPGGQPHRQSAGGRTDQAGLCGQRHSRRVRPFDFARHGGRRNR